MHVTELDKKKKGKEGKKRKSGKYKTEVFSNRYSILRKSKFTKQCLDKF